MASIVWYAAAAPPALPTRWISERRDSIRLPTAECLQVLRWTDHRTPHMRHRAVVEPQPLFRLTEVTADDVGEFLQLDTNIRIERVDVVHGDHASRHVPFVVPHPLVVFLDIRIGPII